jgi:hypothetical protein
MMAGAGKRGVKASVNGMFIPMASDGVLADGLPEWIFFSQRPAARMPDDLAATGMACAVLAGLVGVILVLGRVLRPFAPARPRGAGALLVHRDMVALDTRRRLHLIQVGARSVLLLTGGETDVVVGWMDNA